MAVVARGASQQKAILDFNRGQTANQLVPQILEEIIQFEANLDLRYEVGLKLAQFGQSVTIHVSSLSYIAPMLVIFEGRTVEGAPAKLIQHVSQLSFLLVKLERTGNTQEPRRTIGFIQPKES